MQVFKPAIDRRYNHEKVTSHAGSDFDALPIQKAGDLLDNLDEDTTVIAIDEAQFFGEEIGNLVQHLADRGLRVIVAGLDTDFRRRAIWSDARPHGTGGASGQAACNLYGVR